MGQKEQVWVCVLAVWYLQGEPGMQPSAESQAGALGPPFSCPAASPPWGPATLDHLKTQQKEQRKMLLSL